MSFRDIALPLIARGIPVIPLAPGTKEGVLKEQFERASKESSTIDLWDRENPDYNVGAVCTPDGIAVLDCDVKGLAKRIRQETGQEFPETLVVKSAGKGCFHFYFRQTERSRALGNRSKAHEFDLQSNRKYVVGPLSTLTATGKVYTPVCEAELADFPDWLCDWINKQAPRSERPKGVDFSPTNDDFDIVDMLAHYELEWWQNGDWYNFRVCPGAGYEHEQCKSPGFIFQNGDLGWCCWATGCPSHGKSAGWVIKRLNEDHDPYPELIWPDRSEEKREEALEVVLRDIDPAEVPTVISDADDPFLPTPTIRLKPLTVVDGKIVPLKENAPTATAIEPAPSVAVGAITVVESPSALPENAPRTYRLTEMPEECMYGWLKLKTAELGMPFGYAYPAMLVMAAGKITAFPWDIRPTLYACLIGPIHSGKTVAMTRAQSAFQWSNDETVIENMPVSDRGLVKSLQPTSARQAQGPNAWKLPETRVLMVDEMRAVMLKAGIQNSTLTQSFNTLWSKDRWSCSDKKAKDEIFCRLNVLGGLTAEDTRQFSEAFSRETATGFYDRFIFGLADPYKYRPMPIIAENVMPSQPALSDDIRMIAENWRDANPEVDRARLCENAIRIAYITAAMNKDDTVTEECMQAALFFMEWQEDIRSVYKPSSAMNTTEAQCAEAIKAALNRKDANGKAKLLNWRKVYKNRHLDQFGPVIVARVKKAYIDSGHIIEEMADEFDERTETTKKRPTGNVWWKD